MYRPSLDFPPGWWACLTVSASEGRVLDIRCLFLHPWIPGALFRLTVILESCIWVQFSVHDKVLFHNFTEILPYLISCSSSCHNHTQAFWYLPVPPESQQCFFSLTASFDHQLVLVTSWQILTLCLWVPWERMFTYLSLLCSEATRRQTAEQIQLDSEESDLWSGLPVCPNSTDVLFTNEPALCGE